MEQTPGCLGCQPALLSWQTCPLLPPLQVSSFRIACNFFCILKHSSVIYLGNWLFPHKIKKSIVICFGFFHWVCSYILSSPSQTGEKLHTGGVPDTNLALLPLTMRSRVQTETQPGCYWYNNMGWITRILRLLLTQKHDCLCRNARGNSFIWSHIFNLFFPTATRETAK